MRVEDFQRLARNITAALNHIDPVDLYSDHTDRSDQRIRFRQAPHLEFLKADDATQRKISELMLNQIGKTVDEIMATAVAA